MVDGRTALRPGVSCQAQDAARRGVISVEEQREPPVRSRPTHLGPAYASHDLVHELTSRGRFTESGRTTTRPVAFAQSVSDYVTSFHSRNGFSRDRMTIDAAASFDDDVRALLAPHCPDDVVRGLVVATIVWGRPR